MLKAKSGSLGGAVAALAIAAAFATFGGGSAQAQTPSPVYSGGGTLAANVYRDLFNCWGSTSGGSLGTTNGSNCPVNSTHEVLYAPVGTGAGQTAYVNNDPTKLGTPTSNAPPYTSTDYPNYPYTGLAFGAGDAPLTSAQITSFNSSTVGQQTGPVIQIPTLITSVVVPFNPGSGSGALNILNSPPTVATVTGTSGLMLSRDNLCGIFSGNITDWSDSRLAADNRGTPLASTATPILVVFRDDSSGTTFLMSNALVSQCASSAYPMPTAWGSPGTSYFINAFNAHLLPANFHDEKDYSTGGTETGSGGIADAVTNEPFTISYVSPDYAAPYGVSGHGVPVTANVQNQASVSAGGKKKFIPPGINTAKLIMSSSTAPASADPNVWATDGVNPNPSGTTTYPIGGFTWLFAYTCYATNAYANAMDRGGATSLLTWLYGPSADVPTILNAHGFSQLPNNWKQAIHNYYLLATAESTNTRIRKGPSAGVCTGGAKAS